MKLTYQSGQHMPDYVVETLRYVGKVGVITSKAWCEHLGEGSTPWKKEQLLNLVSRGVLVPHTCNELKGAWVLSRWSLEQLRNNGVHAVAPVPPQNIEHDETVGTGLWRLKTKGVCQDWLTERELKTRSSTEFILDDKGYETKYPDAVFRMVHSGKGWIIAVEYERTGKSSSRYKGVLKAYEQLEKINQILYVVEDLSIKQRFKACLDAHGSKELKKKLGLIAAVEWKKDPYLALIQKDNCVTSFKEIFDLT